MHFNGLRFKASLTLCWPMYRLPPTPPPLDTCFKEQKEREGESGKEREKERENGSDKRRNWLSGIVVAVVGGGGSGGTRRQGHTRPSATSVEHQRIKATTTTTRRQKWNWRSSRTPIIAFVVFCYCSSGLWNMLIWAGRRGVGQGHAPGNWFASTS